MEKILNLDKIQEAKVNNTYFPFFSVTNSFIDNEISKKLTKDFPNISTGGSFPIEDLKSGASFVQLVEELKGNELRSLLEKKFEVNLLNKPVVTTARGISRNKDGKIHSDSKTKVITVLIYLNEEWNHESGLLRLLRNPKDIEDYFLEIPASMGSMIAFKVDQNCWHGYRPFEGKRLSIQLNYLYQGFLSRHNMRHKLSALFKKIPNIFKK